jgi:deoxyribodipyrimidine photolyase-related protein
MDPVDRPFMKWLQRLLGLPCKLTIVENNHFLWSEADFHDWAVSRKSLLMESFYREGRKRFDVLMDGKDSGWWPVELRQRRTANRLKARLRDAISPLV